jgi:hypothetical protein
MCDVYQIFSKDWEGCLDFSDEAKVELFNHESLGYPVADKNGYWWGKKWLNVNVTMWKEDIEKGLLHQSELYSDEKFPRWFLDSVFKANRE